MKGYTRADWFKFRDDVIKLHGGCCVTCGRGGEGGVVLQVHHKHYVAGRLPWQYAYDECEVLCRGCHGREHGILRPSHGWRCLGYSDLDEPIGTCDLCGTSIRYVFLIDHPKWDAMEVGEDCCDNLTDSTEASTHMESRRRYASRLKRFVSSTWWERLPNGQRIRQRKIDLEVRRDPEGFRLRMNGIQGKRAFSSALDAKMQAFQLIESGEAATYLKKVSVATRHRRSGVFYPR
jgi:hypothetical protein